MYLPELVLVPKRQPGIQMDLNSIELPGETETIAKEDTKKKIMYYEKNANFVLEKHDINDSNFTRYEFLYGSRYYFRLFTSLIYSEKKHSL